MKVLFVPHYFGGMTYGGAEIQALRTAEVLRSLGVHVRFHSPLDGLGDVDIVHFFGPHPYFEDLRRKARLRNIRVVVSPIFWPWANSLGTAIKLRLWFALFPRTPVLRRLPEGQVAQMLRQADLVLPNSNAEKEVLTGLVGVSPSRIMVVPNGVENRFAAASPALFRARVRSDDFVLSVGNIEWRKNQRRLIRAVGRLQKPLVIIGSAGDEEYAELCRREGGDFTQFLGALGHEDELLASAYAAARVFALPSLAETPGLAALEAALAGTKVVVTSVGAAREYLGGYAWYCNPLDERDIARQIAAAWDAPPVGPDQREHLLQYTWERVGRLTLSAYERVLATR